MAFAAALALTLGAAGPAFAQNKAGAGKHQACLAKARAENPDRTAGHARQAAYNRCMGR
jgi:F0F1-type ATP synthase membrane subunit c/vacuolar-type H+-ATPase subunit K